MQDLYLIEYRDSTGNPWVGTRYFRTRKEATKVAAAVIAEESDHSGRSPRVVHARVLRFVLEPEPVRMNPAFN